MPNFTVSLDDETHRLVRDHRDVNWSHVVRQAILNKGRELHTWDELLKDSEMTEAEAIEIGRDIKASIARRLGLA